MTRAHVHLRGRVQGVFFRMETRDQYDDFCWFDGFFSREDVARILEMAAQSEPEQAAVRPQHTLDEAVRSSTVRWVHADADNLWLFDRIAGLIKGCNDVRYGFDLWAMTEGLQIADYEVGSFFAWHKDHGNGAHSIRKLSITVQLSDPADYDGGDMEFMAGPEVRVAPKTLGTAIIFPSFVMHRVTAVTRGIRRSLVSWISGPPYR